MSKPLLSPEQKKLSHKVSYKKWANKNKEYNAIRNRRFSRERRQATLALMGDRCIKCGYDDVRALHIDHINGGGTKERKTLSGGTHAYHKTVILSILANENKFQLLCANCNMLKRYENNEINKKYE